MINWKVRLKNKMFWIAIIPAVVVLIMAVASVFGVTIDLSEVQGKLIAVVEAVFVVLGILGIVVDPTTEKFRDSKQALSYTEPKKDETPM